MPLKAVIEDYSLEIIGRAKAGVNRCERLVGADFVSDSPRLLAQALLNIFGYLERVASIITSRIDWAGTTDIIEKSVEVLRVVDWQVKEFAAHVRYVESARTDRLPWQAIPSFEKLVQELRPSAHIMLRPMWHYNYATVVTNLRDLYLEELREYEFYTPDVDIESKIIHPLLPAFHIISFPALERDNILLHSVIGHELGHLMAGDLVETLATQFLNDVHAQIEAVADNDLTKAGQTKAGNPLWYGDVRTQRVTQYSERCLRYWSRAMEEILADALGALLFGPAALFATLDIAVQSGYDIPPSARNEFYPPWRRRIREVLAVVESAGPAAATAALFRKAGPSLLGDRLEALGIDPPSRARLVNDRLQAIRDIAADRADEAAVDADPLSRIAYGGLRPYIDEAIARMRADLTGQVFGPAQTEVLATLIERLDAGVPPNAEHDMPSRTAVPIGLSAVLNAAWYHKASLAVMPIDESDRLKLEKVRVHRNRLTLKAIEYSFLADKFTPVTLRKAPAGVAPMVGGVLTGDDIHELMERPAILERLIVTPLLSPADSIGGAAIDVRLGTEFILFRKEAFGELDVAAVASLASNLSRYQERVVRRVGEPFVLHPRQLVIGSTLEYVRLPPSVMAYVAGKSTWGRTGLVIATAVKIDPGFRGCLTLEMINEGEIPLVLWPGLPIAQLVFHRTERATEYSGVYDCPIGPEFPRFESVTRGKAFWMPRHDRRVRS